MDPFQATPRIKIRQYRLLLVLQALSLAGMVTWFLFPDFEPIAVFFASFCLVALSVLLLLWMRHRLGREVVAAEVEAARQVALLQADPLTGAMTRRIFMETLKTATRPSAQGEPCSLALLDVDHFKSLNDSFGHNVGDFALTHLVEVARRTLPGASIGRLGGDEFAVLLPRCDEVRGLALMDEFLVALKAPTFAATRQLNLSASIGLVTAPKHTSFFEEMILLADLALYESKRRGRGRATVFDPDMLSVKRNRRMIERDLRAAIMLDELDLHYQPITDADQTILGVEALVRWKHPVRGMIPPAEFIPVAEESTLIDMLGEWVLRRACLDLEDLPGRFVTVNISPAQMRRNDLLGVVRDVLKETGAAPNQLVLEITENVSLLSIPEVLGRIQALRAMGVRIALDDFGTGHCTFNYLQSLPVDMVKIDRSYVSRLPDDPVSRIFVSAVMEVARALRLSVVAEGVETEEEFELSRAAGCATFQGYLLGRPLAKADLIRTTARVEAPVERRQLLSA
ncbi:putative bifunctional diguanylate cyclase/phosphodiesterase [Aureimonas sp. AU40]|uniref:putative bifunctional diguanylate cyclase/phosphodiesterase n=1 Tax=Aureimonas sp. AU40 TaxID=1637747 RepID=UPI0007831EE5|nr:bifunctional diguanylate cyclase/phosphodiesterase [Aureimonas sp. AU40]